MADVNAIPPVYDPGTIRTEEEYKAQAALMGWVYDGRDGTFNDFSHYKDGRRRPRAFHRGDSKAPDIPLPEDIQEYGTFFLDCVTLLPIHPDVAEKRRLTSLGMTKTWLPDGVTGETDD